MIFNNDLFLSLWYISKLSWLLSLILGWSQNLKIYLVKLSKIQNVSLLLLPLIQWPHFASWASVFMSLSKMCLRIFLQSSSSFICFSASLVNFIVPGDRKAGSPHPVQRVSHVLTSSWCSWWGALCARRRGRPELGPDTDRHHTGQEQGEGVQAAGGQDLVNQQVQQVVVCEGHLVARDEGLAGPLVLGQWDLKKLHVLWSCLYILLLACLVVV